MSTCTRNFAECNMHALTLYRPLWLKFEKENANYEKLLRYKLKN